MHAELYFVLFDNVDIQTSSYMHVRTPLMSVWLDRLYYKLAELQVSVQSNEKRCQHFCKLSIKCRLSTSGVKFQSFQTEL